MPELPTSNSGSPLTQKRVSMNTLNTSSIPKIDSLEHVERELPPQLTRVRQPLKVDINQRPARLDPEEKGSSAKIVIWVIIVIVLAIAAYLGLKSFLNGPATTDNGVKPTTYVTPVEQEYISTIVDQSNKKDVDADSKASFALFTQGAQNMGADSDTTFDLTNVSVQKYETFTRVALSINKLTGSGNLPLINASYDKTTNEISLNVLKTTTTLDIPENKEILVNTLTVDSLTRVTTDNTMEKFLVKLSEPTVYLLQVSSSTDSPTIYLDIKEVTPSLTPTSSITMTPSITPSITSSVTTTPTPTALPGGEVFENAYSKDAQILNNGLTTNTASFNGYYYFDGPSEFTYKAQINPGTNGKLPSVSAKLDGLTLTVEVTNLLSREASATINFTSVSGIQKMDVVSTGNKRTYTFTLTSSKEYRIAYKLNDTADKQFANALWIQIKH